MDLLSTRLFFVAPPELIAPGLATPPAYTLFSSVQFLKTLSAASAGGGNLQRRKSQGTSPVCFAIFIPAVKVYLAKGEESSYRKVSKGTSHSCQRHAFFARHTTNLAGAEVSIQLWLELEIL